MSAKPGAGVLRSAGVWPACLLSAVLGLTAATSPAAEGKASAPARPVVAGRKDNPSRDQESCGFRLKPLVPLEYDIPDAAFDAIRPDYVPKRPTLERFTGKPQPPLMVPAGCVNLALDKKVTSSDESQPLFGTLSMITDGEKSGGDGDFVELAPGKQWVQIDLERPADISAIVVWHFFNATRVCRGVVVQISDDPKFAKGVTTVFNNDFANAHGLEAGKQLEYIEDNRGKAIAVKDEKGRPVRGRYVRIHSNGYTACFPTAGFRDVAGT
jgi:hypothetical protein